MAYCPECDQNVQIVMENKTHNETKVIEMESDRYIYTEDGHERIGFDRYNLPVTKHSNYSIPHCSICYGVLRFPNATSKEKYYRLEKEDFEEWKNRQINKYNNAIAIFNKEQPPDKKESYAWLGAIVSSLFTIYGYYLMKTQPVAFWFQNHDSKWGWGVLLVVGGVIFLILSLIFMLIEKSDEKRNQRMFIDSHNNSKIIAEDAKEKLKYIQVVEYSHENYRKYVLSG